MTYVSGTDHFAELERRRYPLLPLLEAALRSQVASEGGLVTRTVDQELEIRRRRLDELRGRQPAGVVYDGAPPIDFRPHARARHVVRFDSGGQVLDQTVEIIRSYVLTAEPVGVETGGYSGLRSGRAGPRRR